MTCRGIFAAKNKKTVSPEHDVQNVIFNFDFMCIVSNIEYF